MRGRAGLHLAGKRAKKGDPTDHAVGVVLHANVGDWVEADQPVCTLHVNDQAQLAKAQSRVESALTWSDEPVPSLPLIHDTVSWRRALPVALGC